MSTLHYTPHLCGDCHEFQRDHRKKAIDEWNGYCFALMTTVRRSDFCHIPAEEEKRQEAMRNWTGE